MEIKKSVNLETLTQEEQEAIELGTETEESLLEKHEATFKAQEAEKEAKIKKSEENYLAQKVRAEKAEAEAKKLKGGKDESTLKNDSISQTDLYVLIKANVPQEDIDDVKEYAALKKITIAEALKSNVIKTLLTQKAEERTTAEATNTNASRRGNAKVSGDTLLSNASKGELPESDEDLDRLVEARLEKKNKK